VQPGRPESGSGRYNGQVDGRRAQMQFCTTKRLGDLDLAHAWAERVELLHGVAHELRELVDRLAKL
jgi:hypothetical protein